jgi:hypothetical protein
MLLGKHQDAHQLNSFSTGAVLQQASVNTKE